MEVVPADRSRAYQILTGDGAMDIPENTPVVDEEWYLRAYRDVAKAYLEGTGLPPFEHYVRYGRDEGRLPGPGFDAKWYAKAYPVAREETGSTEPATMEVHYRSLGRSRGYLPERTATRNGYPAPIKPLGLWTDASNAMDLVEGKYELGLIDDAERANLWAFIRDGYLILPGAVPPVILDKAEAALEAAYSGAFPDLRFECHALSRDHLTWQEGVRDNAAKALDLHWFSDLIRDAIFCSPVSRFLGLLFERPALASQTLSFYRGSGQPLHQDSAYVAYTLPLQFVASWIALEDVQPGAGELEYFVGSHRALPEFLYPGGVKNVSESRRLGHDADLLTKEVGRHERAIQTEGARLGLKREKFMAKRGDVLIWHADLAHGGSKISNRQTRKSLVTHYCPKEVAPMFFEGGGKAVVKHDWRSFYTSGVYAV